MAELENEVLTGEVEKTTNTETEVTENSGIGGLGIAIAALAIIGTVSGGKTVYTGCKNMISKAKANLDKRKGSVDEFEDDSILDEYFEVTESEEEA